MPDEPLVCERCQKEVLAVVNVASRSGPEWWCAQCHIEVRDNTRTAVAIQVHEETGVPITLEAAQRIADAESK